MQESNEHRVVQVVLAKHGRCQLYRVVRAQTLLRSPWNTRRNRRGSKIRAGKAVTSETPGLNHTVSRDGVIFMRSMPEGGIPNKAILEVVAQMGLALQVFSSAGHYVFCSGCQVSFVGSKSRRPPYVGKQSFEKQLEEWGKGGRTEDAKHNNAFPATNRGRGRWGSPRPSSESSVSVHDGWFLTSETGASVVCRCLSLGQKGVHIVDEAGLWSDTAWI
jgi:hypothetical protein